MAKEEIGRWSDPFSLSNVAVHASLLHTGEILYWGRRSDMTPLTGTKFIRDLPVNLDQHDTKPYLLNPATKESKLVKGPMSFDGKSTVNFFCGGHCMLPNGKLLIVGGHLKDGNGVNQTSIYDPDTQKFTPQTLMNLGRWYPSVLPLPDGRVFVMSGSWGEKGLPNNIPQIWTPSKSGSPVPNTWIEVSQSSSKDTEINPLYPRIHVSPKGRIFMAGQKPKSWWLDIKDEKGQDIKNKDGTVGRWTDAKIERFLKNRDYAPSVMYDSGKLMYIGGGNGDNNDEGPTNVTEFIDLNEDSPKWTHSDTDNMEIPRKQFNATVLPDGSVLVTGGTKGPGFNNLTPPNPVHEAELYNPFATGKKWSRMASESVDRCYHATALLLPDGRVFSAGSGEYGDCTPNDCFANAQIFEPPYLFKGPRPKILHAPTEVKYNTSFKVTVGNGESIKKVSWVRLGSVTHCRNMNQSLMFLQVTQSGSELTVEAPANANHSLPGHYMLFALNEKNIPSVARMIQILAPSTIMPPSAAQSSTQMANIEELAVPAKTVQLSLEQQDERIIKEQDRPHVAIGLTPLCPYGLGPCWGAAHHALNQVSDIDVVRPVPDQGDSMAFVYLKDDIIPDIDTLRSEFEESANRSYDIRGIEMTLSGVASKQQIGGNEQITLASTSTRPQVILSPFQESSQLKYDMKSRGPKSTTDEEAGAYKHLSAAVAEKSAGLEVEVTGTLQKLGDNEFSLDVRAFEVKAAA